MNKPIRLLPVFLTGLLLLAGCQTQPRLDVTSNEAMGKSVEKMAASMSVSTEEMAKKVLTIIMEGTTMYSFGVMDDKKVEKFDIEKAMCVRSVISDPSSLTDNTAFFFILKACDKLHGKTAKEIFALSEVVEKWIENHDECMKKTGWWPTIEECSLDNPEYVFPDFYRDILEKKE